MVWGDPLQEGQRGQREEGKRGKEVCHGAGPVPQVPHRQGSGVGGTGEDVGGGVGGSSAGGTEDVRGPAYPLKIGVEGRAEPRTKLGQGGLVGAG